MTAGGAPRRPRGGPHRPLRAVAGFVIGKAQILEMKRLRSLNAQHLHPLDRPAQDRVPLGQRVRHPQHVVQCALAGADVATLDRAVSAAIQRGNDAAITSALRSARNAAAHREPA